MKYVTENVSDQIFKWYITSPQKFIVIILKVFIVWSFSCNGNDVKRVALHMKKFFCG